MISFMPSIEKVRPFFFAFNDPKTSDIFPVGRAAFTSILPSGILSTLIFSPGCTPRWSSRSWLKAIWPLVPMVSVLMAKPPSFASGNVKQRAVPSRSLAEFEVLVRAAHSRRGLSFQVAATMPSVIRPLTSAAAGTASVSAAVAAHPIEEKASAKVASREEVWRRRN